MYQCEFMKLPIERPRIPDVFRMDDSENILSDTELTEVTLPENCTYYKTSFPEGCKIKGGKLNG